MRRPKNLSVVSACIVVGVLTVNTLVASAEKQKTLKEMLEGLLPAMGAEDVRDREDAQQQWQKLCLNLAAPGRQAERVEACKLMAEKLGPETPKPARLWLLRQLEYVGRGECVDPIAVLLDDVDEQVRDSARRALANNPAGEANSRLLAKMQSTNDVGFKVGLVNSLGFRADEASISALAKALAESDSTVAAAAARALGKIGTRPADEALAGAEAEATGEVHFRIGIARLACAKRLAERGDTDRAVEIFAQLRKSRQTRPVQLAALGGELRTTEKGMVGTTVLKILSDGDPDEQAMAIAHLADLPSDRIKEIASESSSLPDAGRVLLLEALAARGDKSAMSAAVSAAGSDHEAVRLAGLTALGRLGDASVVSILIETMIAGGDFGEAARGSLLAVHGEGTDEKILAALKTAEDPGRRGTLIEIIAQRRMLAAVPSLLQEALDDNASIRGRAMSALGELAEPKHVPAMVVAMLKAEKGRERDDAEKVVTLVCGRIVEVQNRADPVLALIERPDGIDKIEVLSLLGRIGGSKAMKVIQTALGSNDPDHYEAGIRAICNWPDAGVAEELLDLCQSAKQPSHRIWALRALVRVIALPGGRSDGEKLRILEQAMQLATRDDERKLILGRVAAVRQIETLRFVVPYLDNQELAADAGLAVVDLAHHLDLMSPHRVEFVAALTKVLDVCDNDKHLVERARGYLMRP